MAPFSFAGDLVKMSRYAYLVCEDCRIAVFLGKIVEPGGPESRFFHIGSAEQPRNSGNLVLSKVVMKFLAEHMGHSIRSVPEEDLVGDDTEENPYRWIGERGSGSEIIEEDYIAGFPG